MDFPIVVDAASRVFSTGPVTAPGFRSRQIGHKMNCAAGRSVLESTACSISGIMTLAVLVHASRKFVCGRPKKFNVSRISCAEHRGGGRNSEPGKKSDDQAELEKLREEVAAFRKQAQTSGGSDAFPRSPAEAGSEYAARKLDGQEALALLEKWAVVPECTQDQHSIMKALWEAIKKNGGVPTKWTVWAIAAPGASGIQRGLHTNAPCPPQGLAMIETINSEKNVIHHLISNPANITPGLQGAVIEFLKSIATESNFKNPMELEIFGILTFGQEQRRMRVAVFLVSRNEKTFRNDGGR